MSEFNFITAKEARQRCSNSEAAVQAWLKNIEPKIIAAADRNESVITIHIDAIDVTYAAKLPELSADAVGGMQVLKQLGYGVQYTMYGQRYVPAGMRDDDGNGPMHQNYGIVIRW